jgi:hypothetical protein
MNSQDQPRNPDLIHERTAGPETSPGSASVLARDGRGRPSIVRARAGALLPVVYDLAGRTAICSLPGGERLVVRQGVSLAEATPEVLRSLPLGVTVVYDAAGPSIPAPNDAVTPSG